MDAEEHVGEDGGGEEDDLDNGEVGEVMDGVDGGDEARAVGGDPEGGLGVCEEVFDEEDDEEEPGEGVEAAQKEGGGCAGVWCVHEGGM